MSLFGAVNIALGRIIPITYAIIGFSLLIVVHEFGHFLFAKIFNIHTPSFSIGFGPTLIEKKIGETNFKLSALPLGGYVEVAGLQEVGQGEQKHSKDTSDRSFASKSYWQKMLVLGGGIGFNIAFAYLSLITLFMVGAPKSKVMVNSVKEDSAAKASGLRAEDQILMIDDFNIDEDPEQLAGAIQLIQKNPGKEITFTVMRSGAKRNVKVTVPSHEEVSKKEAKKNGKLGLEFAYEPSGETRKLSFGEAFKQGIETTNSYIFLTVMGIRTMFAKRSLKGAGGPVMILSQSIELAKKGFIFLLGFLAVISINLAIINLIPLPVFDGGHLLFTTVEAIVGREIPLRIREMIHVVSAYLLIALVIYLTYSDIVALIKKKFS